MMIASFSRAFTQDLRRSMNDAEFDKARFDRRNLPSLDQDRSLRERAPTLRVVGKVLRLQQQSFFVSRSLQGMIWAHGALKRPAGNAPRGMGGAA
jgi:hypothetical protein